RVYEPQPRARAGRRPRAVRAAVPLRGRSALRAERRRGPALLHRRARADQPRLRPELDPLLRRLPRPLRAAHLPDRLPHHHAVHPDPGGQPLPHRLLPAPSARPHDQRVLRPGHPGGAPRGDGPGPWGSGHAGPRTMTRAALLRRASLLLPLTLPGAALGWRAGLPWFEVVLGGLLLAVGLTQMDDVIRVQGRSAVATATLLLVLYGTPLLWVVVT